MAKTSKYIFTSDMSEISGLGGTYEEACRDMLRAGLEWFDENPTSDPRFHGYNGVYGIIYEDNDDAKALTKAIHNALLVREPKSSPTGAMVQAVVGSCLFVKKNGWDKYVAEMSKKGSVSGPTKEKR